MLALVYSMNMHLSKSLYIRYFWLTEFLLFYQATSFDLNYLPRSMITCNFFFNPWNLFINYVLFLIESKMVQFFVYLKKSSAMCFVKMTKKKHLICKLELGFRIIKAESDMHRGFRKKAISDNSFDHSEAKSRLINECLIFLVICKYLNSHMRQKIWKLPEF